MKLIELNQTETVQSHVRKQRKELEGMISDFRALQLVVMPRVDLLVAALPDSEPEDEKLYLPSDMASDQREALGLATLAAMELKVREAELYETLQLVRTAARSCSIIHSKRKKDVRGTNAGLRSTLALKKLEVERNSYIADYERIRKALGNLGFDSAEGIPEMTIADTFRRSTFESRQLGDSRRTNSLLYTDPGSSANNTLDIGNTSEEESWGPEPSQSQAGTQVTRRERGE